MSDADIFTAMVQEELNQYRGFFFSKERELLKKEAYKKLALYSLRQARLLSPVVILFIITSSFFSIYSFIQYGNNDQWNFFILGIVSWIIVVISVVFYIKDIAEKKKSMMRVLKLLEARQEYTHKI